MFETNNRFNYEAYIGGSTLLVILGLIFFTTKGHCNFLICFGIAVVIEFFIILHKFIAKITITEDEIMITFHKLFRCYISTYDVRNTVIKIDLGFSENGRYYILKISHLGKTVHKVYTGEGFTKKDFDVLVAFLNKAKAAVV